MFRPLFIATLVAIGYADAAAQNAAVAPGATVSSAEFGRLAASCEQSRWVHDRHLHTLGGHC